jgi:hypothetical protein
MKKVLTVFIALLLSVPAVTHAGSATSRWDMTLGGYVKFDLVYANKAVGVDNRLSPVDSKGNVDQAADSTSNLTWAGAETRMNWVVKGPDAWGAKTSAFIEGEFRGRGGQSEYGLFQLRHAYMQMIWPKTTLLIGQTWEAWGLMPAHNSMAFSEVNFKKGIRQPQIRLTHDFTKNWQVKLAVQSPYNTLNNGNIGVNQSANSLYPDTSLDIAYSSDACGKIGPFPLKIGIGGFWGKEKYLVNEAAAPAVNYKDETIDKYAAGFYWYVPIIPEKKGNKTGALGFTGQLFAGKGLGFYVPGYAAAAYNRPTDSSVTSGATTTLTNVDLAYYQSSGGWAQVTYYFTDKLFTNVIYGAQWNNVSKRFIAAQAAGSTAVRRINELNVNLLYDINPAIRFGIEYDYVSTAYAYNETPNLANKGNFSSVRVGAYYFF